MMNNFIMHPDNSLLLVSRDSGNLTRLLKLLDRAPGNYAKDTLFIFDEVHGAGSSTLVENLSGRISPYQYRLGLSATPEREYDDEGNDFLLNEIGPVIFEFTLQDAIKKGILCEFNYLPLTYRLSEEEKQKKKRIIGAFNAKKEAGEPCDEKDLYTRLSFINKTAVDKIRQFDRFIASRKELLESASSSYSPWSMVFCFKMSSQSIQTDITRIMLTMKRSILKTLRQAKSHACLPVRRFRRVLISAQ